MPGRPQHPTMDHTGSRFPTVDNGRPGIDSRLTAPDHEIRVKVVVATLRDGPRRSAGGPPQGAKARSLRIPRREATAGVSKGRELGPDSEGGGRQGGTAQRCPTRRSPNRHPAQADPTPTPPCRPTPGTRQRHRRNECGETGDEGRAASTARPHTDRQPETRPWTTAAPGIDSRLTAPDNENCVKVDVTTLRDGTRAFGGAPPQGAAGTAHAPRTTLLRELHSVDTTHDEAPPG